MAGRMQHKVLRAGHPRRLRIPGLMQTPVIREPLVKRYGGSMDGGLTARCV